MTLRTSTAILVFAVVAGAVGCGESGRLQPTGPSPQAGPQPPPLSQPPPTPPPSGPADTKTVVATVADAAFRPLAGAVVEVVSGPHAGLTATADANGEYTLTGAFDSTTLFRASRDGYVSATRPLPARCDHCTPNWRLYFYMESTVPSANVAGNYTLTLTADPACAELPADTRTTRYPLEIRLRSGPGEPAHSWFEAHKLTPPFSEQFDSFLIRVVADELTIGTTLSQHGDPWLVAELAPLTYVTASGEMLATVADAGNITGTFHGELTRCLLPDPWGMRFNCRERPTDVQACHSKQHRFTLARR